MAGEYVDLGLSVKWVTMNIGAERIIDHGGYFAWGETVNKEEYTWDTYLYGTSADDLTKYSYDDNKIELETSDDAAAENWGQEWHIPTGAEWEEFQCASMLINFRKHSTFGFLIF